jgi:hypothetical protein
MGFWVLVALAALYLVIVLYVIAIARAAGIADEMAKRTRRG